MQHRPDDRRPEGNCSGSVSQQGLEQRAGAMAGDPTALLATVAQAQQQVRPRGTMPEIGPTCRPAAAGACRRCCRRPVPLPPTFLPCPARPSLTALPQLAQLESTAKGLIDELAASGGAGATPRLRELLATGERLVAAVAQAGQQLGSALPPSSTALPPAPDATAVGEPSSTGHVWLGDMDVNGWVAWAQRTAALPCCLPTCNSNLGVPCRTPGSPPH